MNELYSELNALKEVLDDAKWQLTKAIDIAEELSIPDIDTDKCIFDIDLFKEKLDLFGLSNEKLLQFIDTYMKLYNKE